MTPQSIAEIPKSADFLILMVSKRALGRFLQWTPIPSCLTPFKGKSCAHTPIQQVATGLSDDRGLPILRREHHRPKLGIGFVELKGHGEIIFGGIVHTNHAAVLLDMVLRVDK